MRNKTRDNYTTRIRNKKIRDQERRNTYDYDMFKHYIVEPAGFVANGESNIFKYLKYYTQCTDCGGKQNERKNRIKI